jgi:hypothetical protein
MQFEQALKIWGADKIGSVDPDSVKVSMEFDQGYACCGGRDENCYCSYAQSPSANIVIISGTRRHEISADDFDFAEVLSEIVQAGNGTLTL